MTSKELVKLGAAVMVSVAAVACGAGMAEEGESEEGLSASRKSYITLRRDTRKCAAPMCGGFFVRDVNRKGMNEQYVGSLDFKNANLDQASIDAVLGAGNGEAIVHGKLSAPGQKNVRNLLVYAAWRGMPGVSVAAGDALFAIENTNVQCFAAPCLNQRATKLNNSASFSFSSYDVAGASKPYVDQLWLTARVRDHGALVAGRVVDGVRMAAGSDKVLAASQVFIRLPEMAGPCRMPPIRECEAGKVAVFSRDENRCVSFAGCVEAGFCIMMVPTCDPGYALAQWRGGSMACNAYACDPAFTVPQAAN